jgi:hypothetical protein
LESESKVESQVGWGLSERGRPVPPGYLTTFSKVKIYSATFEKVKKIKTYFLNNAVLCNYRNVLAVLKF